MDCQESRGHIVWLKIKENRQIVLLRKVLDNMSFKMPVGKELDDLLNQLTPKDIEQIRSGFEFDIQKEDSYRMINSNNQPSFKN